MDLPLKFKASFYLNRFQNLAPKYQKTIVVKIRSGLALSVGVVRVTELVKIGIDQYEYYARKCDHKNPKEIMKA